MATRLTLSDAIAQLVSDGDSVALEGFTHLIPFAAGHEILRQGRRELELIRMTPDVLYDQMIGMGPLEGSCSATRARCTSSSPKGSRRASTRSRTGRHGHTPRRPSDITATSGAARRASPPAIR